MTNKRDEMESGTLIGAAVTDVIEAVADLITDPREYVRVGLRELVERYRFPTPNKEREAAHVLRGFQPRIEELVKLGDIRALALLFGDINERCRRIALPEVVPSFHDDLRDGGMSRLLNASWSTEEASAIKYFARPGDRLGAVTPSSVLLGKRELLRAEVREELARRGWRHEYLARWEEIERNRIRVDANNRERAKQGLGPIIYTGHGLVERA